MQKIIPFLWYDAQIEEVVRFYTSTFKNSKILSLNGPKGAAMSATIEIEGQQFNLFNGGPMFKFTEAISLFVDCETQEEIDELWGKLTTNGGQESRCGWLKDKFGLSWQLIPPTLVKMLFDTDREKADRVMQAMLKMGKLDIQKLKEAYDGN